MVTAIKRSGDLWKNNSANNFKLFDMVFETHAPKALGFIMQHTNNKKEAEEYLGLVFFRVWNDIRDIEENTNKKILYHILFVCKPLYKRA